MTIRPLLLPIMIVFVYLLAACNGGTSASPTPLISEPTATLTPPPDLPTDTPPPPTPTPEPLIALINGEPLTLAEFEAELARFNAVQAESGTNLATEDAAAWVLDALIDSYLLAQAAREAGFSSDEASVQTRVDELVAQLGSEQLLTDWMATNGYTEAQFRQTLGREMAAAWMRDQIVNDVEDTADQVHARQILLYNSEQAEQVLTLLQGGQDFTALAKDYDPVSGGDLGWFPRGYLISDTVEEAAFNLQPGEFSGVIETPEGFHIVQLIEREPQHPLSQEARRVLQLKALSTWLTDHRIQSDIQILLP